MKTGALFLMSFIAGYYIFLLFSHPKKKQHKLPTVRYRNLQILPNLKIYGKHRTYHFHHWLILSVFMALGAVVYDGIIHSPLVNGVVFGGILQGLRYKDRFKFRFPSGILSRSTEQHHPQKKKHLF